MDMKTFNCNPDLCNLSRKFFSVFSPPFSGSDPKFRYIFFKKHSVVVQCLFIGVFSFVLFIFFSASWQEIASMVFLFSKIANFVLFARSDLRLGLIYLIICIGE